jgi:hypothetical protein
VAKHSACSCCVQQGDGADRQIHEVEGAAQPNRAHVTRQRGDPLPSGLFAQPGEHVLGDVDAGDGGARLGERDGEPAGAHPELQRRALVAEGGQEVDGCRRRVVHRGGGVVGLRRLRVVLVHDETSWVIRPAGSRAASRGSSSVASNAPTAPAVNSRPIRASPEQHRAQAAEQRHDLSDEQPAGPQHTVGFAQHGLSFRGAGDSAQRAEQQHGVGAPVPVGQAPRVADDAGEAAPPPTSVRYQIRCQVARVHPVAVRGQPAAPEAVATADVEHGEPVPPFRWPASNRPRAVVPRRSPVARRPQVRSAVPA